MRKEKTYHTDQELADGCARCERRAQYLLYERHVDAMYNTAYRYCFHRQQTEDILQSTFTKVFASIRRYDARKGSLKAWIRRICIHTALDVLKKESRWEPLNEGPLEVAVGKESWSHFDTEYILQLIEKLPKEQRMIFNLYEVEGYAHEEIAGMIGLNVNSCRVYLSRAKKNLRKAIGAMEGSKKNRI